VLSAVSRLDSKLGEIVVVGVASVTKTIEQRPLEADPASGVIIEVVRCEHGELGGRWSTDKTQAICEEEFLERGKRNSGR
jgi:hypothetical protein